jgi:glycosyltransferase involved in cell wall biosynthesis
MVVPFYRNSAMLERQLRTWREYPEGLRIILVDDGSPEPAIDIVMQHASESVIDQLKVYRVGVDIPWNRGGARNLGAHVSETPWIMHIDIDHILPPDAVIDLLAFPLNSDCWYRFPRYRIGAADDTRKKDAIDPRATFGKIHPHVDSYVCSKDKFWEAGGYNEDFSGCLGGGSPFLKQLDLVAELRMLPEPIRLDVYTRHVVEDASDNTLSRDTGEYSRRRKKLEAAGKIKGHDPLRFEWSRVL